jgi:hypothetical protein
LGGHTNKCLLDAVWQCSAQILPDTYIDIVEEKSANSFENGLKKNYALYRGLTGP